MRYSLSYVLAALLLVTSHGCGPEPSAETDEARHARLVAENLEWRDRMLAESRYEGFPVGDPCEVSFAFLAPSESAASELHIAMNSTTDYLTSVQWFKEPTQGWFVTGTALDVSLEDDALRDWLSRMVTLGLEYGCEFHNWRIQESIAVRIGWGCITVPPSYRVVEQASPVLDQHYGFVDAPGRPTVEWSFGLSEAHPLCHSDCRILSRDTELIGGRERDFGLLEDAGQRAIFVVDELISFRVDNDSNWARSYVRQLAARYERRERPEECEAPEIKESSSE